MSEKKSSPKASPKKSPKKDKKSSPSKKGKMTAEGRAELEKSMFPRMRYDTMGAVFMRTSPIISLYVRSIHIYEIWNTLPPYEQFCNSNVTETNESNKKSPGRSPRKSSPKKSPKGKGPGKTEANQDEPPKPELEPAVITGVICTKKENLPANKKLFIEVTAKFRYIGHSKVPPFPDNVFSDCLCFRDVIVVHPVNLDIDVDLSDFNQHLIMKLRKKMKRGYRFYPFEFDVTRKPDSLFFTRPFHPDYSSGLFWKLRAYIAQAENCEALPDEQISMEFFKYTITPTIASQPRDTPPVEYIRYSTSEDTGDLILEAQLERDVYYHGQEIKVKIQVENNSSRHVVSAIAVFVEQTYRLNHQFPHDNSIPLGEVILANGDGLPIQPRSKNWRKEVTLKPTYDSTKYDLAVEGRMQTDKKIFLASSTVVMMGHQVITTKTIEPESEKATAKGSPKGRKSSPKRDESPKKKASPKEKGSSGKKSPKNESSPKGKSPKGKQKSPGKDKSPSPPKEPEKTEGEQGPVKEEPKTQTTITEVNTLTNKQACRSAFVSYDVVVRLNLRTPHGDEAGHPMVRLPFILTRETRFIDKLENPPPPTWATVQPH